MKSIDDIDCRVLRALQDDSRCSMAELGAAAGLSASACHRRVKILEERGIIEGYRAVLGASALGFEMMFFIEVSLSSQSEPSLDAFEAAVRDVPEVLECHLMAGQADYLLRIVCRDHEDFERLHRRLLARLPGVARVQSNMSIRTVKARTGLPV
ncbi:MAG: Lrp/AsnC family transcriptional regulator [Alphaproteobacteria bacterium]|nr:Lrp/AsnC family transcriptional regulator [Alphaproteobacteria bacterium]